MLSYFTIFIYRYFAILQLQMAISVNCAIKVVNNSSLVHSGRPQFCRDQKSIMFALLASSWLANSCFCSISFTSFPPCTTCGRGVSCIGWTKILSRLANIISHFRGTFVRGFYTMCVYMYLSNSFHYFFFVISKFTKISTRN